MSKKPTVPSRKLTLHVRTLRRLSEGDLGRVAGRGKDGDGLGGGNVETEPTALTFTCPSRTRTTV